MLEIYISNICICISRCIRHICISKCIRISSQWFLERQTSTHAHTHTHTPSNVQSVFSERKFFKNCKLAGYPGCMMPLFIHLVALPLSDPVLPQLNGWKEIPNSDRKIRQKEGMRERGRKEERRRVSVAWGSNTGNRIAHIKSQPKET